RPRHRPCLLRPPRSPRARAGRVPLDRVRRCGSRPGRSAPARGLPRQRGLLGEARLRAAPGYDHAPRMERGRRRRDQPSADVLAAAAGAGRVKVAACKYRIGAPADFAAFADRQRRLLEAAAAQGAQFAVLPEYLSLELAATFGPDVAGDLQASLRAIQSLRGEWIALFTGLARGTGMLIAAGTFLLDDGHGGYVNRCDLFSPGGVHGWQDKLQLTGFEKSAGTIRPGGALRVFAHGGIRFGVSVCYDSEFPLPVRAQYEAGARLLLVPSCTDTGAGATRVRVGCLARALENRFFVAQAVTAGE